MKLTLASSSTSKFWVYSGWCHAIEWDAMTRIAYNNHVTCFRWCNVQFCFWDESWVLGRLCLDRGTRNQTKNLVVVVEAQAQGPNLVNQQQLKKQLACRTYARNDQHWHNMLLGLWLRPILVFRPPAGQVSTTGFCFASSTGHNLFYFQVVLRYKWDICTR